MAVFAFVVGTWFWWMAKNTPEGEMVRPSKHAWYSREDTYALAVFGWCVGLFCIWVGLCV
jgi:hypothetical protein